jgi:hypothetical protein
MTRTLPPEASAPYLMSKEEARGWFHLFLIAHHNQPYEDRCKNQVIA